MNEKLRVGILGATGMVGQRFISLLENHPWFEVTTDSSQPEKCRKDLRRGDWWQMENGHSDAGRCQKTDR